MQLSSVDGYLSSGERYSAFKQLGPDCNRWWTISWHWSQDVTCCAPANVIPTLSSLHLHSLSSFSSLPNIFTYTEREPFFDFETNSSLFSADIYTLKSTVWKETYPGQNSADMNFFVWRQILLNEYCFIVTRQMSA